ncbi:2-keto-3-deoxygluconate permease [Thermoanaerobacterium thermosaccharolyticum]|uniref:2-keto-3-deoxygluconate permease n=1 Tax=Thermoanaerobacterium thermosaccharolyticum TaxID=1517 RepID=UPI003DA8DFBD
MILNFMKKIPAGMMIVPLFISAIITTFCPKIVQIGSFTTGVFSSAGVASIIGVQLVAMGAQLRLREAPAVLKRGGILLISKFVIGAIIGIIIGRLFGKAGFLGLSALSIISAVTNSNGSLYLSLMTNYGDEIDCASFAVLTINDGPFLTLVALGASGLANIPIVSFIAAVAPIIVGMILGNLDKNFAKFLEPLGTLLIPFVGFTLGGSINLANIVKGGVSGILLGLITLFIGGPFILLCDKYIGKRPGYAAWAVATTAGNAIAVPAVIGLVDKAWAPYVQVATTQVAASCVLTAILVPFVTSWWAKNMDVLNIHWKKIIL